MHHDPIPRRGLRVAIQTGLFILAIGAAPALGQRAVDGTLAFFGQELPAEDTIVYVIDGSGSMNADGAGFSPLDRTKAELIRSIYELPESTAFNLVAYACGIRRWAWRARPTRTRGRTRTWV